MMILILILSIVYLIPISIMIGDSDRAKRLKPLAMFLWPLVIIVAVPFVLIKYIRNTKRLKLEDLKVSRNQIETEEIKDIYHLTFFRFFKDEEGILQLETYIMLSRKLNIYYRMKTAEDNGNVAIHLKFTDFYDCDEDLENLLNSSQTVSKFNL